ncbi:MAG TPA: serine hydrolase [Ignavibacteria bacterium]|nr:serine hydrolase [Ignavibacteria bacterium]HRK00422.1 serine hydrolase [Ignavibacteria bacterium]
MKILFPLVFTVIFFLQLYPLQAQFDPDSLELKISRIVREYVDTNKAGMVVGVIRNDGSNNLSRRFSYGHIRKDTNSPRPDSLTIFHIGSVTKTFTATILSQLIQQGGPLDLNDLVEDHIPLNTVKAPYFINISGDTIKMRLIDLATHFSALPDDPIQPVNDSTTYQMMYHYLNNHNLHRPPGECFLYSNLGISFLGVVLSHTTGKIIDSLFIQRLSDPLGMPDTRITLTPQQEQRRATGYGPNGDSVGYFKNSWPAFYAAGGLYTSLKDFMKYLEFNMGLTNSGMKNVLDSAQKIRRVNNDTCSKPNSTARVGLVWQMAELFPETQLNFYYTWKDGGVPGFSSFICFASDTAGNVKSGVSMIVNQSIPCGKLAVEILKYLNSDMIVSSEQNFTEVPVNHLLSQNYPNPFNPVTKINFTVAQNLSNGKENVTMKVFDISGKEIATLINESKPAGNYSVEFDGTDLPSGVYYYSLAIGDYKETKSMILLK